MDVKINRNMIEEGVIALAKSGHGSVADEASFALVERVLRAVLEAAGHTLEVQES
jgi:hypothetical protein